MDEFVATIVDFSTIYVKFLFLKNSTIIVSTQILNDTRPLRIGYYLDNSILATVPAVKRAVRQAKEYLESKGHTVLI